MTKTKRTPRVPANLAESALIYIGDNHYVDPATGMILSRIGHISTIGYEKVEHAGHRAANAHRLVYGAVHGPIDEGLVVNHINGNKADNRPANLEAVTQGENISHAYRTALRPRHALHMRGEKHPGAKVTDAQTEEIRKRAAAGERVPDLAREFGLSESHTYKIAQKRLGGRAEYGTWNRPKVRTRRKVTVEQEAEIQRRAAAGEHIADLAAEYGVEKNTAYVIARATNGVRREFRKVLPEQRSDIRDRVDAKESIDDLAAEYGISRGHVRKIAREARRPKDAIPD